jgi:hypothetical protein
MSGFKDEAGQKSNRRRDSSKDKAVIIELLTDLPTNDRQALLRFYVDGQPQEAIELAFGLNADHFRELRQSVRARFFEKTGRLG